MSISSSSHLAPDDVARHSFGSVRRGFDPNEVRAYLESIAAGLRGIAERERQLLQELADAEHRAAHPVLDEPTLTAALGTETARVLHSAHEVAAEMVAKSEAEANRLLTEAREEIQESRAQTEARLAEQSAQSEAAIVELRERTNQQAADRLESARQEAEDMLAQSREQCRAMVDEAQGLRARVLADLSKRRKVLHAQIEQLRAGRERLAETVQDVRRSIDVIADDLFAAEDNARLAAEAAGREALERPEEGTPEELAALLLAEESESAATDPDKGDAEAAEDIEVIEVVEVVEVVEMVDVVEVGELAVETAGTGARETDRSARDEVDESPVDALFAKIRAARVEPNPEDKPSDSEARDGQEADTDTDQGAGHDAPDEGKPGKEQPGHAKAGDAKVANEKDEETRPADAKTADEKGGDGNEDEPPEERSPLAIRRDKMIAPIVKTLARRLKRTLQDSQNELLDSLRSKGSNWSTDLLPDTTEHLDTYATAALPALEQASEAGVLFAGQEGAGRPQTDVLLGIAHDLAEALVGPLRRRLSDAEGLDDAEESVVVEHVGSAFREWKGERIERLAGDHVVAAFSAGTIAAVEPEKSAQMEWIAVASVGDEPCPDCEDNGLNGSQQPGKEFPTGHRHPPAHPGCRCLLALSAT
jgi:DivIVA domain-containing protein